ncbi:hypothetical protein [Pontibacter mangrovi]|uniref:Uncharacterized protein n=1 Tax=Pontibacter mangrovi TaxID=2589816 RepID=A0A501W3X8_9BACT|nr:hypothetical protein [Pontibacter mangrovi]TPE44299.1 hypothetical protein FJM65_09100 [Pontibacter mangrovi]
MRQHEFSYLVLILSLYGGLLITLASVFLVEDFKPLVFLLRFSTFWLGSFVLAVFVFLYYTRQRMYTLPKVERSRVLRFSTYLVSFGTGLALLVASSLLLLYHT